MSFRIHSPGAQSWLVDLGRPRTRGLGVPVGGAADRAALSLGNALVGNAPNTLGLEISLAGPSLEATGRHACVVWGASFPVRVNENRIQPIGKTFTVESGDVVTIGAAEKGLRAYFCVRGGFQGKEILGSRSALEPMNAGQELVCSPSAIRPRFFAPPPELRPVVADLCRLRVLPGTDSGQFAFEDFVNEEYTVTPDSNRMGLRLSGRPLQRAQGEMLSSPVCPGTIQVTNDGQAIVLGVEAQTIGGYPRIAQLISADMDKLAQLRPGQRLGFETVDLVTAGRLHRAREMLLREWVTRISESVNA